jgi:hypothetical protein
MFHYCCRLKKSHMMIEPIDLLESCCIRRIFSFRLMLNTLFPIRVETDMSGRESGGRAGRSRPRGGCLRGIDRRAVAFDQWSKRVWVGQIRGSSVRINMVNHGVDPRGQIMWSNQRVKLCSQTIRSNHVVKPWGQITRSNWSNHAGRSNGRRPQRERETDRQK